MRSKHAYFDYAASTPVDPAVFTAMQPYFMEKYGNPGSLHSFGQEAIAALDHARETIADSIGADFRQILFTSSATEANNLALRGIVKEIVNDELRIKDGKSNAIIHNSKFIIPKIIISAIEHESILETARAVEREGECELVIIPVDREGIVDLKKLENALDERTVLVSIMYVNNEVGTVQPITEISNIIRNFRSTKLEIRNSKQVQNSKFKKNSPKPYTLMANAYPLFHTDAAQAFCYFDCAVKDLGVDLMTLSSHKMYGPKGCGVLYTRTQDMEHGTRRGSLGKLSNASTPSSKFDVPSSALAPIIYGGGQEFGMRSGTENIPAIVGMGKAVELADKNRAQETRRVSELKDYFWRELKIIFPRARVNGVSPTSSSNRHSEYNSQFIIHNSLKYTPHILNVAFPGHASQDLLTRLDLAGFAVSAGSACSARSPEASHVLTAMGLDRKHALSSIRFSFGRQTIKDGIKNLLDALEKIL